MSSASFVETDNHKGEGESRERRLETGSKFAKGECGLKGPCKFYFEGCSSEGGKEHFIRTKKLYIYVVII